MNHRMTGTPPLSPSPSVTRLTRPGAVALALLSLLALTGCNAVASTQTTHTAEPTDSADSGDSAAASADTEDGHGAIAGAREVAEPQLHLLAFDANGAVSMLNLLDGTETTLESVPEASTITTDGRYVFAAHADGVSVLDSGVWTWDHVDHFHYYAAEPRLLPPLEGSGIATVATGALSTAGSTGVFFPDSGAAILLDNAALSHGEVTEHLRIDGAPHAGLIAPLGTGALVSDTTAAGSDQTTPADLLRAVDASGETIDSVECQAAAGNIITRVALVVGCADGAVLASGGGAGEAVELTHLAYPDTVHAPATSFAARKGRPTVAGLGDGSGIWLLDTREHRWDWIPTTTPVVAAAAVDDAAGHVVAIGADGTVQVYLADTGELAATTDPLLAPSLAGSAGIAGASQVTLTVDGQRAYVNAAAAGVVYEIDYADSARVARTLTTATTPGQIAEVGR